MSTVIHYSTAKDGSISLLVDAGFADQIFECLKRAGTAPTPPQPAISSKKSISIDANGRIQSDEKIIECEIVVRQPPDNLETILGDCLRQL